MMREVRVCKVCDSGEVEDVCHWLLQCSAWDHLRQPLLEAMEDQGRTSHQRALERERAALVLSLVCKNYHNILCGQLGAIN